MHAFLEAIQLLSWHLLDDLKIVTTDGFEFDLLNTSKTELNRHVHISWLQKVLRDGDGSRRDIGAEHDLCVRSSQSFRKQLDFAESKLLAVTLGGSNLTQDRKFKMKDVNKQPFLPMWCG